jgi:SSS family solute:Na+ symporter
MNLSWIDWTILVASVIALRYVSLSTRTCMKGVADFLSANRSAGRYLLSIAGEMASVGTISFVAYWQVYAEAGMPTIWWGLMSIPVTAVIILSGWVYYRFRETRAMTMAQFLEMRYSRRFRIFAGLLCWGAGVLNFGVFPAVAARFFIYFCGLPDLFQIPGIPFDIATFPVVMAVDLGLALMFVSMGGQITVMITECVQGILTSIFFLVIIATVLVQLQWDQMIQALELAAKGPDASLIHPYQTSKVGDFSIWFYLIGIFGSFYGYLSWQGTQGFNSSARSPHEQQMGAIIGVWRNIPRYLLTALLPVAALAVLNLPEFAQQAGAVADSLKSIDNKAVQSEMTVPLALAEFLPIGVKGLLATAMLFFSFTCHDTYMHSWGSIFIQDVVMPFRKKPLTPEQHIGWLRWSITGVAAFAFLFSWLYVPTHKIMMFFAITGTIWAGGSGAVIIGGLYWRRGTTPGGSGAVIIGGLYWRRGTTPGAFAAMIVGATLGVGGLFADPIWMALFDKKFPINGQWLWFIGMVSSLGVYAVVSLLTGGRQRAFHLETMLHRGSNASTSEAHAPIDSLRIRFLRFVGITSHFTFTDRVLAIALIVWNFGWFAVFLVITAIHFTLGTSTEWWSRFWRVYVILQLCIAVPSVIWFTIGGIGDIRAMVRALHNPHRDHTDNGTVEKGTSIISRGEPLSESGAARTGKL